jgi:hypothetical protein
MLLQDQLYQQQAQLQQQAAPQESAADPQLAQPVPTQESGAGSNRPPAFQ